jgi:type II secretory pathway pseudopilin PulG
MVAMRDERGFSMIELMIAMLVSMAVLGSAATVISGVQSTYAHQMDDVTVEQELRFAMDFIRRTIEQAGSNPYSVSLTNCPSAGTAFQAIRMDPDGDGQPDDIRVQADVGIPDSLIGGTTGSCNQADEDVTIAYNPSVTPGVSGTITRFDRGTDLAPVVWTDAVFTGLTFEYLDSTMTPTAFVGAVRVVRVTLTGQSRSARPGMEEGQTFTLESDVRLKSQ